MIMAQNHPNYTNMSAAAASSNFGSRDSSSGGEYGQYTNFELSDFLEFHHDGWIEHDNSNIVPAAFSSVYPAGNYGDTPHHRDLDSFTPNEVFVVDSTRISSSSSSPELTINNREKKETRKKVAFRTKSQIEILDDGFKWRKYGKKMVKNSPNPRNYYKCSVEGCAVKKRVERDKDDHRYVLTSYEGIHNHHHQGST